ncbi:hypothetical protein BC826DRAFT_709656 [Russula brevipes]|nr:hypothetical protein BC826DRAFT_709656 [Russula brevipes]
MFLVNRYLTELCLLAVANAMSGLNSRPYDDKVSCQTLMPLVSAYGVFSTLTSNLLAFLRVIVLWEKSPRVVVGLSIIFVLSFLVSLGCTIATIAVLLPSVKYNSLARLCYVTRTAPPFIALWAAPMGFEFAVLSLTVYNALSNPRSSSDPLARILHRSGMLFFLCVTVIRGVNIAFTTITEPGFIGLPIYFNWALGTVAISRMLIYVRSSEKGTQELEEEEDKPTVMPLTLRVSSETGSARRSSAGHVSSIELHSFWAR